MPGDVDGMPWDDLPAWVAGVQGPRPPADLTAYEARLPVQCELLDLPVGSIEDVVTAATGPNVSEINWDGLCCPDAPDVAAWAGFLAPVIRAAGWWSPSAASKFAMPEHHFSNTSGGLLAQAMAPRAELGA